MKGATGFPLKDKGILANYVTHYTRLQNRINPSIISDLPPAVGGDP